MRLRSLSSLVVHLERAERAPEPSSPGVQQALSQKNPGTVKEALYSCIQQILNSYSVPGFHPTKT